MTTCSHVHRNTWSVTKFIVFVLILYYILIMMAFKKIYQCVCKQICGLPESICLDRCGVHYFFNVVRFNFIYWDTKNYYSSI